MTKDELKKEAEESLDKMVTDKGIVLGCHEGFCYDEVTDFMSEFAEPREKRIAELEQELEQIKNEKFEKALSQIKHDREVVIEYNERLQKENAELRKIKRECETSLCRAEYQYNYDQLTKAKELLERFLGLGNLWDLDCKDYFPLRKEAEQFISEVKK